MLVGELNLASNCVKLGFSGTGAKGADANVMRLHLLGETLGEKEVKSLGGRISADVRNGLKGSRGSEDEDVPAVACDHAGKKQAREMHYGRAVDLHHVQEALRCYLRELAILAETRIIDEQINGEAFLLGERVDSFGSVRLGQIGGEDFRLDAMRFAQFASEFFEAIATARRQDEVGAACPELRSQGHA